MIILIPVLVLGFILFYLSTVLIFIFLLIPQVSDAEYKLIQNVQENANLRSKIAQSPDKVQVSSFDSSIIRISF